METAEHPPFYRTPADCPNCGRVRVQGPGSGMMADGVCEKCGWDVDGDDYAIITRAGAECVLCHSDVSPYTGRCDNWLSCPNAR